MNINEFGKIMKEIEMVYGEEKFKLTSEKMDVWNTYLGEYPYEDIISAVRCHNKASVYPPTIADILKRYKDIETDRKAYQRDLIDMYYSIIEFYPCARSSQKSWDRYKTLTGGNIEKAKKLYAVSKEKVKGMELKALGARVQKMPSFEDFLESVQL